MKKHCEVCGAEFEAPNKSARFCPRSQSNCAQIRNTSAYLVKQPCQVCGVKIGLHRKCSLCRALVHTESGICEYCSSRGEYRELPVEYDAYVKPAFGYGYTP